MKVIEVREVEISNYTPTHVRMLNEKNRRNLLRFLCPKPVDKTKIEFNHPLAIKVVTRLTGISTYALSKELGIDPKPFYQALSRYKIDESTRLSKVLSERIELFIRRRGLPLQLFDLKHLPLSKSLLQKTFQ